jgi:serine/threonine protein kinase
LVSHLIGTQIRRKNGDIPESFFQELIQLFDSITRERRSTIEAYVASVVGDSEKALIERQDIKKRGLLVNILSLWGNLKNHRLAIRDLKPENIFVSADLSQSDRILSEPSKYSLGLIDLETALKLPGEPAVKPDQPVRTGTPAYATPSHLFPNEILHLLLGNLHRTFYLQDQYSIIGLLFYSATGKILFENTGKLLPEIVMAAQKNRLKNQSLTDLFKHVSWVFWHSAITEFEQKRLEHENLLNRLEIHLPQHTAILLQKDIQDTQRDLLDRINRLLNSQHTLKNSPTLDALNRAKGLAIRRQREKMEKEENTGGDVELLNRKIHFLFTLEYLKTMRETIERITGAFPTLLLDKLLMLLFSLILAFMYRENWSDRNPPVFSSTLIDSV